MTTAMISIEDRLSEIAGRLAAIEEELEKDRRRRESRDDLAATAAPIAKDLYASAGRYLEDLQADGSLEDLSSLGRTAMASAGSLERALSALASFTSLASDAAPVASEALALATARLGELEARGYFDFMRHSAKVIDRVVTAFDEDDIDQLGENVVLILETVKEMTQPEVMAMLRRTASAVQSQQHIIAGGVEETPSLWKLLQKMRDPEVRKGLSRALEMLRMMAADTERAETTQGGN